MHTRGRVTKAELLKGWQRICNYSGWFIGVINYQPVGTNKLLSLLVGSSYPIKKINHSNYCMIMLYRQKAQVPIGKNKFFLYISVSKTNCGIKIHTTPCITGYIRRQLSLPSVAFKFCVSTVAFIISFLLRYKIFGHQTIFKRG